MERPPYCYTVLMVICMLIIVTDLHPSKGAAKGDKKTRVEKKTQAERLFGKLQQEDRDPFLGNYKVGESDEIVIIWSEPFGATDSHQKVYDYVSGGATVFVEPSTRQTESGSTGVGGDRQMDVITGDLTGDSFDNIVAAWEGPDHSVVLVIPEIEVSTAGTFNQFNWSVANRVTLPNALMDNSHQNNNTRSPVQVRLVAGFFDRDPEMEFALAYWAADKSIKITIFDTDGTLVPNEKSSIMDEMLDPDVLNTVARFDLAAGDFDGDGDEEIILVASEISGETWRLFTKVYDYESDGGLMAMARNENVFTNDEPNYHVNRLSIATGDFDNDVLDEVAILFQSYDPSSDDFSQVFLQPLVVSDDLSAINYDPGKQVTVFSGSGNIGGSMTLATGDLNADGRDEVFAGARGVLRVYESNSELDLTQVEQILLYGFERELGHRSIALADLDGNKSQAGNWLPELVVVENREVNVNEVPVPHFQISIYGADFGSNMSLSDFSLNLRAELLDTTEASEQVQTGQGRPIALALGDFDGNGVRLGQPKRTSITEITQPLVILNAPPTHFDVINGEAYDVNACYNNNDCDFVATYETETTNNITLTTEFSADWATSDQLSGEAGGELKGLGLNVSASLEKTYGEGFSNVAGSTQTLTISDKRTTTRDDLIYASIIDYDVWEYPVYSEGEFRGYVMVVNPNARTNAWFGSKSATGTAYLPGHEVGNILSYGEIAQPSDNSALAEAIRYDTGDRTVLDGSSTSTWALTSGQATQFTGTHQSNFSITQEQEIEAGFELDFLDLSGSITKTTTESYTTETLSTVSIEFNDTRGLSVDLAAIDLSVGETQYAVTPYAYWAKNGALVLDYAVKPELGQPGGTPTWWQVNYLDHPDPAFVLPWRQDEEKGNTLEDPAKKQQSKSLLFNPTDPEIGDVVTIAAQVRNFSLLPTAAPVGVRFYVGDPADGGIPIMSTQGETEVFTQNPLPARGSAIVTIMWEVTDTTPRFPRIYAVIDSDDNLDEIHEDNNIGWSVLLTEGNGMTATSVETTDQARIPVEFSLSQNYPNPFNPSTTIRFDLPKTGFTSLKVFNVLGEEIETLVNENRTAGTHRIEWKPEGLANGLYFYRLEVREFVATKKLVFIK